MRGRRSDKPVHKVTGLVNDEAAVDKACNKFQKNWNMIQCLVALPKAAVSRVVINHALGRGAHGLSR